jgi:hypothetical protein
VALPGDEPFDERRGVAVIEDHPDVGEHLGDEGTGLVG